MRTASAWTIALAAAISAAQAQTDQPASSAERVRAYTLLGEDADWSSLKDRSLRRDFWNPERGCPGARRSGPDDHRPDVDDYGVRRRFTPGRRRQSPLAPALGRHCGDGRGSYRRRSNSESFHLAPACRLQRNHGGMRRGAIANRIKTETVMIKIAVGFVLSFLIGAGCRYFDIPAASPPVIPGALIVLAMTLGYTSMDRVLIKKDRPATTKNLYGGPTGLPKVMADSVLHAPGEFRLSAQPTRPEPTE
jgi:XapX domain-containing protein